MPPVLPPTTTRAPASTAGQYGYPSSWTIESNGISLTLRMEPATPRVGDTVTFTMDSSAPVGTDYCCVVYLYVNGETVYTRFHGQGPCPLAQGPAVDKATYVATRAGTLGLQLQASRVKLCIVDVGPAHRRLTGALRSGTRSRTLSRGSGRPRRGP